MLSDDGEMKRRAVHLVNRTPFCNQSLLLDLELPTQGDAIGSWFCKESRIGLLRCDKWRVERNLRIIDIEHILCPAFDRPFVVRTADTDTCIYQREPVLFLAIKQIRTSIIIAGRTSVHIE